MEVKNLRIGNLLNWNGCVCPVVEIHEDGFTVADPSQTKLNSNYHYFPDEIIVGWELTDEWLELLGFERHQFAKNEWTKGLFSFKKINDCWFPATNDSTVNNFGFHFVHQLQNWYFSNSAGTELKIDEIE